LASRVRCAAIEPNGLLHVLAVATGAEIAADRVAGAERCLQIHFTGDERRFYIAFSRPFDNPENFRANAQRDDPRNPLVNGVLCAFDRLSGRMLWNRRFEDGVFAIDQSRVAPLLAFSYRHVQTDEETHVAWPMLHCIDKRTGRDVYFDRFTATQQLLRVFVETDLSRRQVMLRFPEAAIRFQYPR